MPTGSGGSLRIAHEGLPIIGSALITGLLCFAVARWIGDGPLVLILWPLAVIAALFALFSIWFFRDPERLAPNDDDLLISAADGRVLEVTQLPHNRYTEGACIKVSIFMSPFNVHVNRAPITGTIDAVDYHPGKFLVASLDKASEENERNALVMTNADGHRVASVQIAGLVARRIVCRVSKGQTLGQGQRYGLIRFGSRMEHYLPPESEVLVAVGQKVRAGETAVARLPGTKEGT